MSQYQNIILLGDCNCEFKGETLCETSCEVHNLKNLIQEPICFKNPEKPTIPDLILTNKPNVLNIHVLMKRTADLHKMTMIVMKVIFKKQKPKIVFYHNYKIVDKKSFKEYLKLSPEAYDPSAFALKDFQNVCLTSLNSFAPLKKKYVRANQASFMNKEF